MTQLRLDKIQLSSYTEPFTNYDSPTGTITITGVIAPASSAVFSTNFIVTRSDIISDVYATNQNTGIKTLLNAGTFNLPYQFGGVDDRCFVGVGYSANTLTVTYTIEAVSGVTLVDQVHTIEAVLYEVPYTQ